MVNRELYKAMIEEATARLEEARKELARLEAVETFETLEEVDRYKHDKKDAEEKEAIFMALLHELKEALEFREYEAIW